MIKPEKQTNSLLKMKLFLAVDNTGSMGQACEAANASAGEVKALCNLLFGDPCVTITVYGDYDKRTPDHAQGGFALLPSDCSSSFQEQWMQKYMKASGGGGAPEATRTSLNMLLQQHDSTSNDQDNVIFIFTDAPPHDTRNLDCEGKQEERYLTTHRMITDWDELCLSVKDKFRVVTFLTRENTDLVCVYSKLGDVLCMESNTAKKITEKMMDTFYALVGNESALSGTIEPMLHMDFNDQIAVADPLHVINTFKTLLNPNKPTNCLALTTNPTLGKYWRLICGRFKYMEDGRYESECQEAMDKLSNSVNNLSGEEKAKVKEWIDKSHDATEMIRDKVQGMLDAGCTKFLVLPEELKNTMELDDLLDLGRGGSFGSLSRLICSLELIEDEHMTNPEDGSSPQFVPMEGWINPRIVFRLLANVIFPGVVFSKNVAALAAILGLRNVYLKDLSERVLSESKGEWIKWGLDSSNVQEFPMFWTTNFIRLLSLCPQDFLTRDEIDFSSHYRGIATTMTNLHATIDVTLPLISTTLLEGKTWKRECSRCRQKRCFTLFPPNTTFPGFRNVCVLCTYVGDIAVETTQDTFWAQCRRCHVNYSVVEVAKLIVHPKCHYCRQKEEAPFVECRLCHHKYVSQEHAAQRAMNDASSDTTGRIAEAIEASEFVCPRCVHNPRDMVSGANVKILDIMNENPQLKASLPDIFSSGEKLWKRVVRLYPNKEVFGPDFTEPECKEAAGEEKKEEQEIGQLTYQGYPIFDSPSVSDLITETLTTHTGVEACQLCASDVSVFNIVPVCGHCPQRVCRKCTATWYGSVQVGHVVSQSHTQCPFCKAVPIFQITKKMALGHIRNIRQTKSSADICSWQHNKIFALCTDCMQLKPAFDRECAAAIPSVSDFRCESCLPLSIGDVEGKQCPGCGIVTQKNGGCNHLHCAACDCHWCWECARCEDVTGEAFDGETVYDHMAKCAGIFPVLR